MGKKRKLRSVEPESSTRTPETEQIQTTPQPEQQQQQTLIASEQVMEQDQIGQPQETFAAVPIEETVEEETENMEDEEEGDEEGNENENQAAVVNGDKAAAEEVEEEEEGDEEGVEDLEEEPIEKILEPFGKDHLIALVKEAVSKLPEFMESVQKLADLDPSHRKIFVHGLGWDSNKETLISVFSKYGEIEDCKAVSDKLTGKSKGYGFILFKHRKGARKALIQPQKQIGNRLTSCQLAAAGPVPAPPAAPPASEYTQRKIFISNVSADIDPHKITEFFAKYGEIEEGPLGLDKQTRKFKGFCLFVYKSVESAKKALEEPQKMFDGKTLNCQKAVDGPKPNKPQFPQQQQYQHQHHQHHHHSFRKEKTRYPSAAGPSPGHLMAPSGPSVGFNPSVPNPGLAPAIGQALTALMNAQGAGLDVSNLFGGLGASMNQGMPPNMNNQGYGSQPGVSYGSQPAYLNQGGYQNPQMGQGPSRPAPGGPPSYMGYGQ
ncbi:UBP1-associated protein 2A-like [Impatiens glandulifera]|uniref:UBP1-associated protein 2A-like n=1 Tax=Impatiens glandulifera TaxID=253017 RepID=UPI001FB19539|nr:UBP1-associated protein 2A-like [Impatiens glandulifera]XP_047307702.1 UBP1-associated protein 2A-like [Impatiens glandulifera]XP_047307703.1 UBP1-associated protein 2A-like [Impatiens glandulifera]